MPPLQKQSRTLKNSRENLKEIKAGLMMKKEKAVMMIVLRNLINSESH